jgi:hypothetical protein
MISALAKLFRTFGANAAFAPVVVAVGLTAMVFFVPMVFRWFEDRKS